jgi:long-chain acyl-CoA synthetase
MTSTAAPAAAAADPKSWLKAYPPTVQPTIDVSKVGTVTDIFLESVRRYGERDALESFGHRITYATVHKAAQAIGSWLQAQGLKKGDRVALMMPNVLAYPASTFGVLMGGFAVVNVNPLYTPRELIHQLNDSGARAIIVLENFAHTVEAALPQTKIEKVVIARPGDLMGLKGVLVNLVSRYVKKAVAPYKLPDAVQFSRVLAEGSKRAPDRVAISPDDVAFLQYTGGTTGVAKGATLLHRNVSANLMQIEAIIHPFLDDREGRLMVTALPLYHILALTGCGLFMCRLGACQVLIANPRDLDGFVKILQTRPFTSLVLVNTLYNALANHPEIGKVDFSNVEFCTAGGMATQAAVAKRWKALTGKPIVEGYGLSETSPVVSSNFLDLEEFSGTIGYPVPSTDVSIRSVDGKPLPIGEAGELCIKGPQVMAGYWNRPDETAKVMTADRFFRSGDVAVMLPDGALKIVDRLKDMVLVSGFNVYPNEIEDVLASHPGVLEAAVVGVPDEHSGEAVAAYIVRKDPALTEEAVRAHCRENLTGYKVPRTITFRDALPKTNVGKVLRRALREEGPPPG